MSNAADLVSVIIPAWNASATIDRTLRSVRGQTHRYLDIVVVDDGSSDDTVRICTDHAASDPRIRVITQGNGGVAAARNCGISKARGDLIAPIDADDLWDPSKLEKQLALLQRRPNVALVYTWFAIVDAEDRIAVLDSRSEAEGDVLKALCLRNIVGNGSSALMRRRAMEEAGGYDTGLRQQQAEGCEDYKLYFKIAERHEFALVREYLTGYRELPSNMSSNLLKMLRSRDLCVADFRSRHPEFGPLFDDGRIRLMRFMLSRAARCGRIGDAARLFSGMLTSNPRATVRSFGELARRRLAPPSKKTANGNLAVGDRFPFSV